jgi:putative DNA-invertase from lambdoid prophage Rac
MSTILYVRVSAAEGSPERQRSQAEAAGFRIDRVVTGHDVSGVRTRRADREPGERLFDNLAAGDTLVVRWLDRLGRNDAEVCKTIRRFMKGSVVIRTVINDMTFDGATIDPVQQAVRDALIGFMTASAEAQAEAARQSQRAGIEHAKLKENRYRGRKPSYTREQLAAVRNMLAQPSPIAQVAEATGLSRQTIYRIKADPAGSEAALATWGVA